MTVPLAKTSVPSVRSAVVRERLLGRLDAPSRQRVLWVSGAPGAGKTTLVATYVAARRRRCLWYHVDAGDADVASFFFYLSEAAAQTWPGRRRRLPLLTPEYHGSEAAFARRFFRELVSTADPDLLLVFDDVTAAGSGSAVCLALREGLEELGPGARAILVSRLEPPAPFARLIANDDLAWVAGEDLRLTPDEALSIARLHAPPGTTPEELARVCARADGWAAGVVLLASRAGRPGVAEPSHPALFDYLAIEFFDSAPGEVRNVLLDAAVVAPLPARLAQRLCGSPRATAILEDLAKRAYLTSKRGDAEPVFEFHQLFREFLLERGLVERTEDELRALRARAGALLASEGYLDHAMSLLLEARAWSVAADVALAQAAPLVASGRSATLAGWLASLPVEERERRPWVSYWLGTCRTVVDTADACALLERAWAGFEATADVRGLFASCVGALEAVAVRWGDFRAMDPWLTRIEELLDRGVAPPTRELEVRLAIAMFMATVLHRNQRPELLDWESRALAIVRDRSTPAAPRLTLGCWFLLESAMRGESMRSREVVEALAPIARARDVDPAAALGWLWAEAVHCWHSGAASASLRAAQAGLSLARESGVHVWDYLLRIQGVNAALAGDDLPTARSFLAAASECIDPKRPLNLAIFEHERSLVALRAGDLDAAEESGREAAALGERAAVPFFGFLGHVVLALAAAQRGDAAAAHPHLAAVRGIAGPIRSSLGELLCEICEAELERRARRPAAAAEHVGRVLRIVREKGVAPEVWCSRPQLAELAAIAAECGVEPDAASALVRRLDLAPPEDARELEGWPWAVRVRVLGALRAEVSGRPLAFRGRSQRRPLELLAAIAASGSRDVAEHVLEDALWPESDDAHHALESSLHRLRRMLGRDVVTHRDRTLSIDPRRCWVDSVACEAALARASADLQRHDVEGALRAVDRAVRMYTGPFLASSDVPWVLFARTRLRRRWHRAVADLGRHGADPLRVRELVARIAAADAALGVVEASEGDVRG